MTCCSVNTIIKSLKDYNDCKRGKKNTFYIYVWTNWCRTNLWCDNTTKIKDKEREIGSVKVNVLCVCC